MYNNTPTPWGHAARLWDFHYQLVPALIAMLKQFSKWTKISYVKTSIRPKHRTALVIGPLPIVPIGTPLQNTKTTVYFGSNWISIRSSRKELPKLTNPSNWKTKSNPSAEKREHVHLRKCLFVGKRKHFCCTWPYGKSSRVHFFGGVLQSQGESLLTHRREKIDSVVSDCPTLSITHSLTKQNKMKLNALKSTSLWFWALW